MPRIVLVAIAIVAVAACEQARPALNGPSPLPPSGMSEGLELGPSALGSMARGQRNSAAQESGFTCGLAGLGLATQSHATISNSGNQTLHCSGQTTLFTPERTIVVEGTPCQLHYENEVTTDSRLVVTPSGQVSLMCQSKI